MPNTASFTPMQLLELRSDMEQDFARLLRSMTEEECGSSLSDATNPVPDPRPDWDTMPRSQSQARLTTIAAALRRLDRGAYGKCVRCGGCISFDRLSKVPEATLCAACRNA